MNRDVAAPDRLISRTSRLLSPEAAEQGVAFTNYGDEDIPVGPWLSAYPLHTDEWRQAFLDRLAQVGYIGLIEAVGHVYNLLIGPKQLHCSVIGQLANVDGAGKLAIYNTLRSFLDEYLYAAPAPSFEPGESLEHWHGRVMAKWDKDRQKEVQTIVSFAKILNGEQPSKRLMPVRRYAEVIAGPWSSQVDLKFDASGSIVRHKATHQTSRLSMADPSFVEGLVRQMLEEARAFPPASDRKQEMSQLVAMWAAEFSPDNKVYLQKWSLPEALSIFLRLRGYGEQTPAEDFVAPVKALLIATLDACLHADAALRSGEIGCDQACFWIDASVEDCQRLLRGYDNPAD